MKQEFTITIYTENSIGLLNRIAIIFSRRKINIESPDYVQLSKAYRLTGKSVKAREDLKVALSEMLKHKRAYLLEVIVGKENNVFPMVEAGTSVSDIRLF